MADRKTFLQKAAAVLVAASPVLSRRPASAADDRYAVLLPAPGPETYGAATTKSYTTAKYLLSIGGVSQGPLQSVEGGHATSDVVEQKLGSDVVQKKHIAGVKYEDVMFKCGLGLPAALSDWLKAALRNAATPKDVSVIAADYNMNEVSEEQFTQAVITEIGFPACDASSKEPGYLTVKFQPASSKIEAKSGKAVTGNAANLAQKGWIAANFRLTIPNVDCTKIAKIESLTWKGKASSASVGAPRVGGSAVAVAGENVPNLVVTVATSSAKDFLDWQKSIVAKGAQAQLQKTGTLEYLAPDLNGRLLTLGLNGLLLFKATADKTGAPGAAIERMTMEMTVESLSLTSSGPSA